MTASYQTSSGLEADKYLSQSRNITLINNFNCSSALFFYEFCYSQRRFYNSCPPPVRHFPLTNMTTVSASMWWTLYTLGLLGFYRTWIRSALNGPLSIVFTSLHVTGTLPGGGLPLKTSLTGIYWPLDYLLNMLIVFFWQVADGSHRQVYSGCTSRGNTLLSSSLSTSTRTKSRKARVRSSGKLCPSSDVDWN